MALYLYGSNITIDGSAVVDSGLTISGSDNTVTGGVKYKVGAPVYPLDHWTSCEPNVSMTGNNPGIDIQQGVWTDWPVDYAKSDFPCTYNLGSDPNLERNGPWWVDGTMLPKKKFNPGVICYDGSGWMFMQEDGVSGNVTFRAKNIDIGGTGTNFTAYSNGVLFFSDGTSFPSVKLDPVGGRWEGLIYNRYPASQGSAQGGQSSSRAARDSSKLEASSHGQSVSAEATGASSAPMLLPLSRCGSSSKPASETEPNGDRPIVNRSGGLFRIDKS